MIPIRKTVHTVVLWLTLPTLATCIGFPIMSRHLFFTAGGLALLAWLGTRERLSTRTWMVLAPVLFFGLFRIGYTLLETGTLRPASDAWQVYLATGNRLIVGCILAGYLLSEPNRLQARVFAAALFCGLALCLLQVLYATFHLNVERGSFGYSRATMIAYEAVTVYLVFLGICLKVSVQQRLKWLSVAAASIIVAVIVMLTETRAAILALIVLVPMLCLLSQQQQKGKVLGATAMILLVITAIGYPAFIKPRIDKLEKDVSSYVAGTDRRDSVGARLEMWRASLFVFESAPIFGAGYQGRLEVIQHQVALRRLDPVTQHFATVHMHNEYLEELSLHGVTGLLLLLWMYGALLCSALRRDVLGERRLSLLALAAAYAFFGLTDVLFFSREASVLFVVTLALCLAQREIPVANRLGSKF